MLTYGSQMTPLMIFICAVVIQRVVYLVLGQRVTGSRLCHIIRLNYGIRSKERRLAGRLKTPVEEVADGKQHGGEAVET